MRLLTAILLALVFAPAADAAPPLIGREGHGTIRALDADLDVVPGSPALPRSTYATVFRPDRQRFASWGFYGKRVTLRDRATWRAFTSLPLHSGNDVFWPSRHHVLTVTDADFNRDDHARNVLYAHDLKRGTVRRTTFPGLIVASQAGRRITRFITNTGTDYSFTTRRFTVVDVGAAGAIKRRFAVPVPDDFGDLVLVDSHPYRDLLVVSDGKRAELVRISTGTTRRLDVPGGYYRWVGPSVIAAEGRLIGIDEPSLRVVKIVDTGLPGAQLTSYAGGVVVGFGRARYDTALNRVAANPSPALTQAVVLPAVADRLYALLYDCDSPAGIAIADAVTGAAIRERPGDWLVGVLGEGPLDFSDSDDVCD